MSDLHTSLKAKLGGHAPFIALVALYLLMEIAQPGFFARSTQLGLLADSSTLFIMAAGTTFVVLIGSIDLSLQAVASLSSVIVALLLPRHGALAAVVALAAAVGGGLLGGGYQPEGVVYSFFHGRACSGRNRIGCRADALGPALHRDWPGDAQRVAWLEPRHLIWRGAPDFARHPG